MRRTEAGKRCPILALQDLTPSSQLRFCARELWSLRAIFSHAKAIAPFPMGRGATIKKLAIERQPPTRKTARIGPETAFKGVLQFEALTQSGLHMRAAVKGFPSFASMARHSGRVTVESGKAEICAFGFGGDLRSYDLRTAMGSGRPLITNYGLTPRVLS